MPNPVCHHGRCLVKYNYFHRDLPIPNIYYHIHRYRPLRLRPRNRRNHHHYYRHCFHFHSLHLLHLRRPRGHRGLHYPLLRTPSSLSGGVCSPSSDRVSVFSERESFRPESIWLIMLIRLWVDSFVFPQRDIECTFLPLI